MVTPSKVEYMETNFDLTKPRHSEQYCPSRVWFSLSKFRPASRFCLDFSYLKQRKNRLLSVLCHPKKFIRFASIHRGKVFYTLQKYKSIISKDFHFLYNLACLKKLNTVTCSFSLSFFVGLVFQGAFSVCNRCASPCRTEERRRQYLVGGYFAIIIQAMFERATKLRRLTWRYLCCM